MVGAIRNQNEGGHRPIRRQMISRQRMLRMRMQRMRTQGTIRTWESYFLRPL